MATQKTIGPIKRAVLFRHSLDPGHVTNTLGYLGAKAEAIEQNEADLHLSTVETEYISDPNLNYFGMQIVAVPRPGGKTQHFLWDDCIGSQGLYRVTGVRNQELQTTSIDLGHRPDQAINALLQGPNVKTTLANQDSIVELLQAYVKR